MSAKQTTTVYGYDGTAYGVGDRVEIHPGTDLWMRGARYGTVVRMSLTPKDRVHVRMDKVSGTVAGTADTFRLVDSCLPAWLVKTDDGYAISDRD